MMARNICRISRHWQWLAALVLLIASSAAHAAVQEMRVVGVGIDNSSLQAEEMAMDYARKRAVYLATRKLGVENAAKRVAKFTDADYNEIIRGANVVQTRRQGYVTYAEINVTIVDEALRRALKLPADYGRAKVPDFDLRGVLVLSVYVGAERPYLWEKENELRAPLADEIRRQAHGMVLLPGGDLDDLRLIDYQNALTVKRDELKPMFERYGADEIIIVVLTPSKAGTKDATSVLLRRLKLGGVRNEVMEIPPVDAGETTASRLEKAANAIAAAVTQIASSTSEREYAIRAAAQKVNVQFAYSVPKELAQMQEIVRADPGVLYLDMPSIALARVDGTIYLKTEDNALRERLVKQGIIVTPVDDGWQLSLR